MEHNAYVHRKLNIENTLQSLIRNKKLSQDKMCIVDIISEHFRCVRDGRAKANSYIPPNLLVTGGPGTGKSWLINLLTEIAEIIELEVPIKTAFMGIAAINIGGFTFNSFLDVPVEMNEGGGSSKHFKPWDIDHLQQFKKMYNMKNLSAIIIDEISMVKPWMVAYLDERLKEATQNFNKPFGGIAVIMFGDFDQQPPIGGSSLPHFSMTLLEQEHMEKDHIYFTKCSKREHAKINSTLCCVGAHLFESA
jgi:hypothetical protein